MAYCSRSAKKPLGSRYRRPKWVNGRIKRYPPLPRFNYDKLLRRWYIPFIEDARRGESVWRRMFEHQALLDDARDTLRKEIPGFPIVYVVRSGRNRPPSCFP